MKLPYRQRQLAFVERILSHRVFNEALKDRLGHGDAPTEEDIVKIMESQTPYGEATLKRRASTVRSWIKWILSLIST